jgi:hypothetical protein
MNDRPERLVEGLDPNQQAAIGNLEHVEAFLDRAPAPDSTPSQRLKLLAVLESALPPAASPGLARTLAAWLKIARSQAVLLETPFWWSNGIILLLGLLVTLLDGGSGLALILLVLSPVLAVGGVAYAFRPSTRGLWELEKIAPISPLELLYTRLVLSLAVNLLIALALSSIIWVREPQLILWRLILVWLGPLFALSGAALLITLRWGSVAGALVPLGMWGLLFFLGWQGVLQEAAYDPAPLRLILDVIQASNQLATAGALAFLLGLFLLFWAGLLARKGFPEWD